MNKKLVTVVVFVWCLLTFAACGTNSGKTERIINSVRNQKPEGYDFTIEEAFHAFFEGGSWKLVQTEEGTEVVEFTGQREGNEYVFKWIPAEENKQNKAELYYAGSKEEEWTENETNLNFEYIYHVVSNIKDITDHGGANYYFAD